MMIRPANIPDGAVWDEDVCRWIAGPMNAAGERHGTWRAWAINGALLSEKQFDAGRELSAIAFYPDGVIAARRVGPSDGITTHECFHPKTGALWCSSRYRGEVTGMVAPEQVLSETICGPDGKRLRETINEYDDEGLVAHRELGPEGNLRFENVRTRTGRELRIHRQDGELELVVRMTANETVAVLSLAGNRQIAIDRAGVGEHTRRRSYFEHTLGGQLLAAEISAMPRSQSVASFVAEHRWAKTVPRGAPETASVANFLTALTSGLPLVADVCALGLAALLEDHEDRIASVSNLLAEIARAPEHRRAAEKARSVLSARASAEKDELAHPGATEEVELGQVTLPSEDLVIVDMGAMSRWSHDDAARRIHASKAAGESHVSFAFAHVNAVCVFGLPVDRELRVVGKRTKEGPWKYVSLVCKPTTPVNDERIAALSVEEARFMFADAAALAAWDHERTIDGLYDVIFFGAGEREIVEATLADVAYEGIGYYGWTDLPPGTCPPQFVGMMASAADAGTIDFEMRPHSTHHALLRGAWTSPHEAGTATIGGAKMCGLFSSVGDGVFPVFVERDAESHVCRVTVKLK